MSDEPQNVTLEPLLVAAVDVATQAEQRTLGASEIAAQKGVEVIQLTSEALASQVRENLLPSLAVLFAEPPGEGPRLDVVRVRLGFSLEGKLFIASGKVDAGLELEFRR